MQRHHRNTNNRFLSGEQLLGKGMAGWTFKTDNRLRGAYAETDLDKKVVRLNKRAHRDPKKLARQKRYQKNANGTENMLNSIVHELEHAKHPTMGERRVVGRAKKVSTRLSTRQKKKMYALFR